MRRKKKVKINFGSPGSYTSRNRGEDSDDLGQGEDISHGTSKPAEGMMVPPIIEKKTKKKNTHTGAMLALQSLSLCGDSVLNNIGE